MAGTCHGGGVAHAAGQRPLLIPPPGAPVGHHGGHALGQLGLVTDAESLRGAIVTPAQLAAMAALLAETLGIAVDG